MVHALHEHTGSGVFEWALGVIPWLLLCPWVVRLRQGASDGFFSAGFELDNLSGGGP